MTSVDGGTEDRIRTTEGKGQRTEDGGQRRNNKGETAYICLYKRPFVWPSTEGLVMFGGEKSKNST